MRKYTVLPCSAFFTLVVLALTACSGLSPQAQPSNTKFSVIPLGTRGGLIEQDLSAYLIAPLGEPDFIALDAGTLFGGLQKANEKGNLPRMDSPGNSELSPEGSVLQNHIKAYAISHAHLDHVAGLVINSPDDSPKPILGLPSTIDNIRDHLFNWKIWPNFANEGAGFQLNKYQYVRLHPGENYAVNNTKMTLTPFELSHSGGYTSTAFLIESGGDYMLYFGDVGPDAVEQSDKLLNIWTSIAPLVREKRLHGIFLEASFPNDRPDKLLFGHLTPKWMMHELRVLAKLVAPGHPKSALDGLKVVVTHIKPSLNEGDMPGKTIMNELSELNDLGIEFILPESGKRLLF